jgi:hypothetical protein
VLLLILAVVFHIRYAAINGTCHTGLGQVGQAFSGNAYLHCAEAANFESGVGPFVVIGLGLIVLSASELVSLARKAA